MLHKNFCVLASNFAANTHLSLAKRNILQRTSDKCKKVYTVYIVENFGGRMFWQNGYSIPFGK